MAASETANPLLTGVGHVVTYVLAVATTFGWGRVKDLVADVGAALSEIDEAASLAERQLRLHAGGQQDLAGLAVVFTTRTHLGVIIDRLFGKREGAVLTALSNFSAGLDVCDPGATGSIQIGQSADVAISNLRLNQRALRSAVCRTAKGRLAGLFGRKAGE